MKISDVSKPGLLRRFLQFFLGTSEAAVAIHFHAPWRSCTAE